MQISIVVALVVVAVVQALLIVRVHARLQGIERVNERLSHFAEALALLTDTTEAGLANVASALEQPGRRSARAGGRAATSRRIVTAARRGQSVTQIAAEEALSESEIRLHLEMAPDAAAATKEGCDGTLRV